MAAYMMGLDDWKGLLPTNGNILYLGAGNGYTVSFLSDVLGDAGSIYAVEFSKIAMRDLLDLSQARPNINPILGDARRPESYMPQIPRPSWLLQDISQRDQVPIFLDHVRYLTHGGTALLSLKLGSLGSDVKIDDQVDQAVKLLSEHGTVLRRVSLDPYEKEHIIIHLERDVDISNLG